MFYFTKLAALSALLPTVLGQLTVYPPGGSGIIEVTLNGHSSSNGCLNANAQWITAGDCATVSGNGQGGTGSNVGFFVLDEDSNITTTTVTWSTAWVGSHVDQAATTYYLQAGIGKTGTSEWGGPVWFASEEPAGETAVTLNGHDFLAPVQVVLTFVPDASA